MWKKFIQSEEPLNDDLKSLESAVRMTGSESHLSPQQNHNLKAELFSMIEGREGTEEQLLLIDKVKNLSATESLGPYRKKLLFQIISSRIEERGLFGNWFNSLRKYANWRVGLASFLSFSFLLSIFIVSPLNLRVTRASKWTYLEQVQGEVYVNRAGKIMAVNDDFALIEGDLVVTRSNSFVVIRYLDDSVTRLGENTSLQIKRLYVSPSNAAKTHVELELENGQVWASVYNLINGESEFKIETDNATAGVRSKAAFELKSGDETTELNVFDNVVDVADKSSGGKNVQSVVAGFGAKVEKTYDNYDVAIKEIKVSKVDSNSNAWVTTNMEMDEEHEDKLKQENLDFVASAVNSEKSLGLLADFKDSTKAIFANQKIEEARKRFIKAHLGFIRAQEFLNQADKNNDYRQQATPLLIQYKTTIRELVGSHDALKEADAAQADLLIANMREEVDLQRKALSLVLPKEKLAPAKQVAYDSAELFSTSASERSLYLLDRASSRLLEVQELIANNNLKGADASFRMYLSNLDELVVEVEKADVNDIENKFFDLMAAQVKQFKILTAIEQDLSEKQDYYLSGMVLAVKMESLRKLVEVAEMYPDKKIPYEIMMDLKNSTEIYFQPSEEKERLIGIMNKLLTSYDEYQEPEVVEVIDEVKDVGNESKSDETCVECEMGSEQVDEASELTNQDESLDKGVEGVGNRGNENGNASEEGAGREGDANRNESGVPETMAD